MSEWLDLMVNEVARKRREAIAAEEELKRRAQDADESRQDAAPTKPPDGQSK